MNKSEKLKSIILSRYKSIREFSFAVGIPNTTISIFGVPIIMAILHELKPQLNFWDLIARNLRSFSLKWSNSLKMVRPIR